MSPSTSFVIAVVAATCLALPLNVVAVEYDRRYSRDYHNEPQHQHRTPPPSSHAQIRRSQYPQSPRAAPQPVTPNMHPRSPKMTYHAVPYYPNGRPTYETTAKFPPEKKRFMKLRRAAEKVYDATPRQFKGVLHGLREVVENNNYGGLKGNYQSMRRIQNENIDPRSLYAQALLAGGSLAGRVEALRKAKEDYMTGYEKFMAKKDEKETESVAPLSPSSTRRSSRVSRSSARATSRGSRKSFAPPAHAQKPRSPPPPRPPRKQTYSYEPEFEFTDTYGDDYSDVEDDDADYFDDEY